MNKGINKWIGIGNLTRDPEVRYLPQGSAVANINIACNDSYRDKSTGNIVDATEFVRVVFYGKLAEIAGEFLKKGSKVYVEGSLHARKWTDKQTGQDKYSTEIKANTMQMLDGRPQEQREERGAQQNHQSHSAPAADDFDDGIPF